LELTVDEGLYHAGLVGLKTPELSAETSALGVGGTLLSPAACESHASPAGWLEAGGVVECVTNSA